MDRHFHKFEASESFVRKHKFLLLVLTVILPLFIAFDVNAQSQSQNGQIEGTITDHNRASVPNTVITVTNIETGATRSVRSDESGVYRFPLLPLGTYRIAECYHRRTNRLSARFPDA